MIDQREHLLLLTHHHIGSWANPFLGLIGAPLRNIRLNPTSCMRAVTLYVLSSFESLGQTWFLGHSWHSATIHWLDEWMKALIVIEYPFYKQLRWFWLQVSENTNAIDSNNTELLAHIIMTLKNGSLAQRWVTSYVFRSPWFSVLNTGPFFSG